MHLPPIQKSNMNIFQLQNKWSLQPHERRYYSGVFFIKTDGTELSDHNNTGQSTTMLLHVCLGIHLVFVPALFLQSCSYFLIYSLNGCFFNILIITTAYKK